ncbi:MAG TPA: hypothetical protein VIT38_11990 [Allosphingosinicella sp.]
MGELYAELPGMTVRELKASSVDRDAHRSSSVAQARRDMNAFPGHVEAILAVFRAAYPLHIVATVACWSMSHPAGPNGVSTKGLIDGIEQHHVELLQALMMMLDRWEWGREPAENRQIQTVIDEVKALATAFHRRRMVQLENLADDLERATVAGLQERLRDHTQMVRNWGRYEDMVRIVRTLHAPLDGVFASHHGYSASDVVDVADALVALHQERIGGRFVLLKDIFRSRTRKALVHGFFSRYEGVAGDPDEFLSALPKRMPLRHLRTFLQSHADRWLVMEMLVPPDVIAARTGKPVSVVRTIFQALSLRPGSLRAREPEHLFLANPVWLRPGLHVDDDFLFFAPQTLVSFLPSILRDLVDQAGLTKRLKKRRALYLEEETARLISTVLPTATILRNVEWDWQGRRYETDLVAIIDRVVIIAEAKSGALTDSGLRGAPDSVRRHVQSLLTEPALQSARLRDVLAAAKAGDPAAVEIAERLGLDPAKVETVIRISVTLDDFSTLASAQSDLKRAGWFPADLELPPTLGLADLCIVADILDDPFYFLHYFLARSRIQGQMAIFGDELDYLGTYLSCGLELPEIQAGTHKGMFSGMSLAIDRYHMALGIGHEVEKPRPAVKPFVEAILRRLRSRGTPSWTTMGLILLDAVPPGSEGDVEAALEELAAEVAGNWGDPAHRSAFAATGAGRHGVAVFHVFPRALEEGVLDRLVACADEAMESAGTERCVVFGRMLERWNLPYDIAAPIRVPAGTKGAKD